jgi:hypothetical protein
VVGRATRRLRSDLVVNAADVPSVRALAGGTLVAHWMQEKRSGSRGITCAWRGRPIAGTTWSKPVSPHHDGTKTQHGFASLFQAPGAGLGLVWLDGRAADPESPKATGNMSLRTAVFSRARRQLQESAIDARVCDCCPTAVATTSEGPIVAFRNRSDKEVRDIFVSRLVAGRWTTGSAVHADGWEIEACPVNGPAVSARAGNVAVAWFSAKDEAHTFVALSHDAGRTSAPRTRGRGGTIGHVGAALLNDGRPPCRGLNCEPARSSRSGGSIQRQRSLRSWSPSGDVASPAVIAQAGDELVLAGPEPRSRSRVRPGVR